MSSLAIPPITDSLPPQALAYTSLLGQLSQAIDSGDLTSIQTLYNKLIVLALPAPSANNAVSALVSQVGSALKEGSVAQAQSALSVYNNARQSAPVAAPTPPVSAPAVSHTADATLASGLVSGAGPSRGALPGSPSGVSSAGSSSSGSLGTLFNFFGAPANAAPAGSSGPGGSGSFDSLVTTIQNNLDSLTPSMPAVLASLSTSGNFVDTTA